MGCIYEAMDRVKEKILATYKDRLAKYGRATRYFLNPKYHYKSQLGDLHNGDARTQLIDFLERMVPIHAD